MATALYICYRSERPQVIAYLEYDPDHTCVSFVVENIGRGMARDVSVDGFDFALVDARLRSEVRQSFIACGIPVLVPNAKRVSVISCGGSLTAFIGVKSTVVVRYKWRRHIGAGKAEEPFVLDYYSFCGSVYMAGDLHKLAADFEKLRKTAEKIQRDLAGIEKELAGSEAPLGTSGDV